MLPFDMTIPFIVFTDDGAVIAPVTLKVPPIDAAPVVFSVPFSVIPLLERLIRSLFADTPILLELRRTPHIRDDPVTSSLYPGLVVPIPTFPSSLTIKTGLPLSETTKSPVDERLNVVFADPAFSDVSPSDPSCVKVVL